MGNFFRQFTRLISACAVLFIAASPLQSAEQNIRFSAFVPASSGNLSFGPLKAYAEGAGKRAGLQLTAGNQSSAKATIRFEAFDGHFNRVDHVDLPSNTTLYPGETRKFLAVVPIMEDVKRRYRICAVLKSKQTKETRMCGKYIAQKR